MYKAKKLTLQDFYKLPVAAKVYNTEPIVDKEISVCSETTWVVVTRNCLKYLKPIGMNYLFTPTEASVGIFETRDEEAIIMDDQFDMIDCNSEKHLSIGNSINADFSKLLSDHLKHLYTSDVVWFADRCLDMIQLYAKKNHDYGNSFDKGMTDIGPAYGIGRLYDKMNRLVNLSKNGVKQEILDESKLDTLKDLACYAVMTLAYYSKQPINNSTKNV